MNYLVNMLYIEPDIQTNPRTITYAGVFEKLDEALDFLEDNFDGRETFIEFYVPQIIEGLKKEGEYFGDDYSAGQQFRIKEIKGDTIMKIEE